MNPHPPADETEEKTMEQKSSTIHELAAGDESDLQTVMPWAGPYIDPETGGLREPLPESYLVATSVGWPKEGTEELGGRLNAAILEHLWEYDGLLAAAVAVSESNGNAARNLMLWRDHAALDAFLASAVHMDAARQTRGLMYDWEGTNWTSSNRYELPTFDEARRRLDEARGSGPSSYTSP